MTPIRRLALRTLNAIVRHAPPGMGDWGMAALREMDFIENDWRALLWAVASVTLLFQRAHLKTGAETFDIRHKTQGLQKQIRRRTLAGYVICFFLSLCFGWFFFTIPNLMARIGSILTVASTLFFEYQLYHWRGRVSPQRDANTSDLHSFFRAELERQLDFHTGICFWSRLASMIPGYVLFCVGFAIAYPAAEKIMSIVLICFFALALLAIPANLKRARTYQRQINELDSPGLS